jgi:outer membrane receptor for ferrienterochelin and colicin
MTIGHLCLQPSILSNLRLCTLTLALLGTPLVHAQESNSENSTIVYEANFFDQYTPISANDMITRIPGVNLRNNSGGRGLGSGGDLLINGKRIAGKDNSANDQLSRIAADQVDRIEIIRGSSAELDVRGASQVVNIVLKEASSRSSLSAEINMDYHHDDTIDPGASIAYGGQTGNFNYLFGLKADPRYNAYNRDEYNYDPDMALTEVVRESNFRDQDSLETSMNLGYDFERDRIQLNGLYSDGTHPSEVDRDYYASTDRSTLFESVLEATDNEQSNWEIGGNYEHNFANSSRFQLLFITNEEVRNSTRERFTTTDNARDKTQYLQSDRRTRERIAQASYSWSINEDHGMQLGLERAQTILDTALYLGSSRQAGTPSSSYGDLAPVLSSSNPGSTVEEMRYEGFAVHNWTLNDKMSLESTLLYEASTIEQSGTAKRSRDFGFLRPKVDYRYDLNPSVQLRATAERAISQLSFASFTATTNNSDPSKDTFAGNPDLGQEKEMRYELGMQYRLPNDGGVINSRLFYRNIDDVIGQINVSNDPANPQSATGNLGKGKRYGLFIDASTRLAFLGMPDALVTSAVNIFDSSVYDPILGTDRRFNRRGNIELGYNQDIPELGLNYGFTFRQEITGGEKEVNVDTIDQNIRSPQLQLFISKVAFENITFRLESMNTLGSNFCRDRFRYDGLVSAGRLTEVEDSCSSGGGQKVALRIRTTF